MIRLTRPASTGLSSLFTDPASELRRLQAACEAEGGAWYVAPDGKTIGCEYPGGTKEPVRTGQPARGAVGGRAVAVASAVVAVGLFVATVFLLPGSRRRRQEKGQLPPLVPLFGPVPYRGHGSKHEVCRPRGLGAYHPTECVGSCDHAIRTWTDARSELVHGPEWQDVGSQYRLKEQRGALTLAPGLWYGPLPLTAAELRAPNGGRVFAFSCDRHEMSKASTRPSARCAVLTTGSDDSSCGVLDGKASEVMSPRMLAWAAAQMQGGTT